MRKLFFLALLLVQIQLIWGNLTSDDGYFFVFNTTDSVFVYNSKIHSMPEIKYPDSGAIEWMRFDGTLVSNQKELYPDGETGYILKVNGVTTNKFWVIDYAQYLPQLNHLTLDEDFENKCEETQLILDSNIPPMTYSTLVSNNIPINRKLKITYDNIEWAGEDWSKPKEVTPIDLIYSGQFYKVEAPLCPTSYTILIDEEFTSRLIMDSIKITSDEYHPRAISSHPTTIVVIRTALNEVERPSDAKKQEGSAPLDMRFKSFPTPGVQYFNWTIFKNGELIVTRHEETHPYIFDQAGKYKVYLNVSNDFNCTHKDSIEIEVKEALLEVPSVFTPNGYTYNDEVMVKYRSIIEYKIWIKNRWGRTVYYSEDPQKGWDGKINGKDAAASAYFYFIKAKGAKGEVFDLKGPVNLVR